MIRRLRKERGAAHPFFWAGFVLVGDWRTTGRPDSSPSHASSATVGTPVAAAASPEPTDSRLAAPEPDGEAKLGAPEQNGAGWLKYLLGAAALAVIVAVWIKLKSKPASARSKSGAGGRGPRSQPSDGIKFVCTCGARVLAPRPGLIKCPKCAKVQRVS